MTRLGWDEYFMAITKVVAERSTCCRRRIGALIIYDRRILTTGYNGAPSGLRHCTDIGCLREERGIASGERHELCRGMHAEQNAIIQAASSGVSIRGGTLYTTHFPCVMCAKMIINAKIARVVFNSDYPDRLGQELLAEAGLQVKRLGEAGAEE
ncbi:MAG: cytidine/deoxycytidylate deaminase family protein [Firmicutes bacterium]|nr:cytidine/deoxycytidylate deaminase family protein [Dethiobacter sp.]MBS3887731.1 cytidine/deoxycytidylate deaminase family protein [Bacillota bacterium]